MKRFSLVFILIGLVFSLVIAGCTQKKAASSQEAIKTSQALETAEEKVDYLVGQAKAFYNSKDFQDAIDVAQHVLRYLDKDSTEAKALLEKAREQLEALAKEAVEDVKKKVGSFGQ